VAARDRPLLREPLRDAQPVDGVHPREGFGDRPCLVGLDLADEVPGQFQVTQGRHLLLRLLQVALADMLEPGVRCGAYRFGGMALGDGDECDAVHTSPVAGGGGSDALSNALYVFRQILRKL
jgi:hypothetical protein